MRLSLRVLTRKLTRTAVSAIVPALAALLGVTCAVQAETLSRSAPVEIRSQSVVPDADQPERENFGAFRLLGLMSLTSDDARFGGLSALRYDAQRDRFIAIGDVGTWLTFTLRQSADGRLQEIADGRMGVLIGPQGESLAGKDKGDSEGLSLTEDGFLVSFEGQPRIYAYAFEDADAVRFVGDRTPPAIASAITDARNDARNRGLEGITRLADGRLLALSEGAEDSRGRYLGWLGDEGDPSTDGRIVLVRPDKPFRVTDAAGLASGEVILLERRFSRAAGPGMQMRLVAPETIAKAAQDREAQDREALLDGEVLVNIGLPTAIDNMEGLAVRPLPDGRIWLYVISDNNFNSIQRTLLYAFEWRR